MVAFLDGIMESVCDKARAKRGEREQKQATSQSAAKCSEIGATIDILGEVAAPRKILMRSSGTKRQGDAYHCHARSADLRFAEYGPLAFFKNREGRETRLNLDWKTLMRECGPVESAGLL
jgi:hypothetical protein